MGQSLDDVRIHTNRAAEALADHIDARAFTWGTNIAFAAGQFQPESEAGRRLLAHELVHVAQQRAGRGTGVVQRETKKGDVLTYDEAMARKDKKALVELSGQRGPHVYQSPTTLENPRPLDANKEVRLYRSLSQGLWWQIDCADVVPESYGEQCYALTAFLDIKESKRSPTESQVKERGGRRRRSAKTPIPKAFPWVGIVVTESEGLTLRSSPEVPKNKHENSMGNIARGADVEVLGGHEKAWFRVRAKVDDGAVKEGYVVGAYVDPKPKPEPKARGPILTRDERNILAALRGLSTPTSPQKIVEAIGNAGYRPHFRRKDASLPELHIDDDGLVQRGPFPKKRRTFRDRKASAAKHAAKGRGKIPELDEALAKRRRGEWGPGDEGLIRKWIEPMELLLERAGDARAEKLAKLLAELGDRPLTSTQYRSFRRKLRDLVLVDVQGLETKERIGVLRDYLRALRDRASQGQLFSEFRARELGKGNMHGITTANQPPTVPNTKRKADGVVEVISKRVVEHGGPPTGIYAAEDKAGFSFNAKQAARYAEALKGGWRVDGVVYFAEDVGAAEEVMDQLEKFEGVRFFVGYFEGGGLKWVRRHEH